MAAKGELLDILDVAELKDLLTSASVANARDLVEHDLLLRRREIELELSGATAMRNEAIANRKAADDRISQRLKSRWHAIRLGGSFSVLGLVLLMMLAGVLLDWSAGRQLLGTWRSPFFWSWIATVVWSVFYVGVAVVVFETDFYLRRLPARRRRIHDDEKLSDLRNAVNSAEEARRQQLVALVRNHVTEIVNSSQGPMFESSLRTVSDVSSGTREGVTVGVGLSEVSNDDNRIGTDVQQRLVQILTSLPGASIGISGPRGVGKSTLLAALCGANPTIDGRPAIAISTSAPVEYDGREFLLHLFSSLCRQVLRTEGQEDAIGEDRAAWIAARRWQRSSLLESLRPIGMFLVLVGTTLLGIALMLALLQISVATDRVAPTRANVPVVANTIAGTPSPMPSQGQGSAQPAPSPSSASSHTVAGKDALNPTFTILNALQSRATLGALLSMPLFTLGVVALVVGSVMFFSALEPYRRILFRPERHPRPTQGSEHSRLVARAVEEMRNIGFQRSYTSGWSGSLKVPVGLEIGSSDGLTLAQQPESLPELVERFRSFVRRVAEAYDNVVLIGIDELDKLKTAQQAEAFLNGIKSVFGIPRCFYLISVSEHALAAFERRGIGFRDAFDSALDDVVQVDFLNLKQSRLLLNRRILRLPDPFLQVCHMLSGGLPRDLIRHARALLDYAAQVPDGSLSLREVVGQMVARDLTARLRATSIAMRAVKETPETSELLVKVASLPPDPETEYAMAELSSFRAYTVGLTKLQDSDEGRTLLRIADELRVYYDTMVLLCRVAFLLSTREGWERATELGLADRVAGVRQALEVGVPLAEVRLAEARKVVDDAAFKLKRELEPPLYSHTPAGLQQQG